MSFLLGFINVVSSIDKPSKRKVVLASLNHMRLSLHMEIYDPHSIIIYYYFLTYYRIMQNNI